MPPIMNESVVNVVSRSKESKDKHGTPSQSPSITLPPELLLEIIEHSKSLGPDVIRALSQVCRFARKAALSNAYATLSREWNFAHLVALPLHLRSLVQHAWIEDLRTPPASVLAQAWFCQTVGHVAMPVWTFLASLNAPIAPIPDPAPLCLTLHPSWQRLRLPSQRRINSTVNEASWTNRITHLRFHVDPEATPFLLEVVSQLPCLTHVALKAEKHDFGALVVIDSGRALLKLTRAKVLVIDELTSIARTFMLQARAMIDYNQRFYLVTGALSVQGMLAEWEDVLIHGAEDIWTRAERIRKAVIEEDEDEIKRICGVIREG